MQSRASWKLILLFGLLYLFSCIPAHCKNNQFSLFDLSKSDRVNFEHQIKKQFHIKDPYFYKPWTIKDVYVWNTALFKTYRILKINVTGSDVLEIEAFPSGGSIGTFAYDGQNLVYLNGMNSVDNLMSIFKSENVSFESEKSEDVAKLMCISILQHKNDEELVLSSPEALEAYEKNNPYGQGYKLDHAEYLKCLQQFKPPTITGNKNEGWKVCFCVLHGWMHKKQNVCLYEIDISPQYNMQLHEKILSEKIFSSIPAIMY